MGVVSFGFISVGELIKKEQQPTRARVRRGIKATYITKKQQVTCTIMIIDTKLKDVLSMLQVFHVATLLRGYRHPMHATTTTTVWCPMVNIKIVIFRKKIVT